jgi:hypothetical protein
MFTLPEGENVAGRGLEILVARVRQRGCLAAWCHR